jgi:hypothetical protein
MSFAAGAKSSIRGTESKHVFSSIEEGKEQVHGSSSFRHGAGCEPASFPARFRHSCNACRDADAVPASWLGSGSVRCGDRGMEAHTHDDSLCPCIVDEDRGRLQRGLPLCVDGERGGA